MSILEVRGVEFKSTDNGSFHAGEFTLKPYVSFIRDDYWGEDSHCIEWELSTQWKSMSGPLKYIEENLEEFSKEVIDIIKSKKEELNSSEEFLKSIK